MATWQAYMDEVIEPHKTSDLSESQLTAGNLEGGLTTIEEKAFGNLEKIGKHKYIDVLAPAAGRHAGRVFISWTPPAPPPVCDFANGRRFHRPPVSDRPGQCHWQPHRAGD